MITKTILNETYYGTSSEFTTLKEFKKSYDDLRLEILERHGITDSKKARLKDVIVLYQEFEIGYVRASSKKTDMADRIKMHEKYGKETKFILVALA